MWMVFIGIPLLVVAFYVAFVMWAPAPVPLTYEGQRVEEAEGLTRDVRMKPSKSVEVVEWDPDRPLAAQFGVHDVPVIIRNSVVSRWRAVTDWTPASLKERVMDPLRNVYHRKENATFLHFTPNKPLTRLLGSKPDFAVDDMTPDEFFRVLEQDTDEFYYWSGSVSELGSQAAVDISPYEPLIVDGTEHRVKAWFASKGVVASCHYDGYMNFFVQVYGHKRFTLFAPDDFARLYLHPHAHAHHRQSQVNLQRPDPWRFRHVLDAQPITVDVYPGDVLFLPPYWFHHVESLSPTLSVNVWSTTPEILRADAIDELPIPFEASWPTSFTRHALGEYADMLVTTISPLSVAEFAERLVRSRFITLPRHQLDLFTAPPAEGDDAALRILCGHMGDAPAGVQLTERTISAAYRVRDALAGLPQPVRELLLEDYLQMMIAHFVDVRNTFAYLVTCLVRMRR